MAFKRNNIPLGGSPQYTSFGIGTAIFIAVLGLIFMAVGFFMYNAARIDESWTRIQGTVIDIDERESTDSDGDTSTTYSPIVEYTVDNQTYIARSSFSSSSRPSIGASHEVAYNPSSPGDSKLNEGPIASIMASIFFFAGVAVFCVAIVGYIRNQKRTKTINHPIQPGTETTGVATNVQGPSHSNSNAQQIPQSPFTTPTPPQSLVAPPPASQDNPTAPPPQF